MKKYLLFLLIIPLVYFLIFYSKKETNNNDVIKLSEVTHSVFYIPLYIAIEKGYFKENNIEIELILTPGADKVATSVLSNDTNIGLSGPEATIYVYNNSKQKLITFASLTKKDGQFIVGDCKYKNNFNMSDLKNKKVLAGRTGGMPLMMFKYALKESNIDEKDIDIDTSVEFAGLTGAYIGGNGDFVNLFEPNASNLEKEKYGCVLSSLGNITGNVPYTAFYAKEEYINNNKELIKRFNNSINKSLEYVKKTDSTVIAKDIIKQFPDTDINDLKIYIDRYKKIDAWYDTTYINIDDYNRLLDIMLYGKTIDKKINVSTLLTNEFN